MVDGGSLGGTGSAVRRTTIRDSQHPHFGVWPVSEAVEACYGSTEWPLEVPVPQASVEFEVEDVATAADELEQRGYRLIHGARSLRRRSPLDS